MTPVLAPHRVLRHGLPTSAVGLGAFRDGLLAAESEPADAPVDGLEAITSPPSGLGDPMAYVQAITDATRRIAMIEVDGMPRGTGLLVGPDLLLTAAHVLDARNWPPPGPPTVVAVFDRFRTPGRSPAETGMKIAVSEFICASLPTPDEVDGVARDWNAPADRLDFALLRLADPVPPPVVTAGAAPTRGHYRIEPDAYPFGQAPLLFIVHHPLGEFQAFSYILQPPQINGNGTRIRYQGNTLQGSSGSPVLDPRGRLVAIHHYSGGGTNQGVPILEDRKHATGWSAGCALPARLHCGARATHRRR